MFQVAISFKHDQIWLMLDPIPNKTVLYRPIYDCFIMTLNVFKSCHGIILV